MTTRVLVHTCTNGRWLRHMHTTELHHRSYTCRSDWLLQLASGLGVFTARIALGNTQGQVPDGRWPVVDQSSGSHSPTHRNRRCYQHKATKGSNSQHGNYIVQQTTVHDRDIRLREPLVQARRVTIRLYPSISKRHQDPYVCQQASNDVPRDTYNHDTISGSGATVFVVVTNQFWILSNYLVALVPGTNHFGG